MKLTLKILKLLAILIITVSIILFSASFLLREKVGDIVLKSLNKNLSTKLDVGSFKLSFLRKFPNASLELKNVLVHSSFGFNSDAFSGINTDTLLAAEFVSVEFNITDILNGIYNIEKVSAKAGSLNLFTDTAGLVNYDISNKKDSSDNNIFTLNLEKINLTDIKANYINLATRLNIKGLIKNGRFKSRITGDNIDFTAESKVQIDYFQLYNTRITKTITTELDLSLGSSRNGILFKKGTLSIDNYNFGLKGFISSDKMLDLSITGNNINIKRLTKYLPDKYFKQISEYDPSGTVNINSSIKGLLTRTSTPHIEINCLLKNGHVAYGKSDLTISDLSFDGYYSNGSKNHPGTSAVYVKDLKAKLGSADYAGSFKLSPLDHPVVEIALKGKVFPGELKEFFDIQYISTASGYADIDLNLMTNYIYGKKYTLSDIIDMKPEAEMVFDSLSIGFKNDTILFTQVNGNLSLSDSIRTSNLQFNFKGQQTKIDGEFVNLPEWLIGRKVQMIATADVAFSRFFPELFFIDPHSSGKTSSGQTAFILPGDILLDVNFKIDSLIYKSFSSSKIKGSLNYKPRILTIKSLNMESLDGVISGNGFIFQNDIKSVIARGNFSVSEIDVNKTFKTFHNFGQDFLKAENLAGTLSGSFSLLLPMDSMLNPQIKSLTAEGKYTLINGALIDFDPVKQLSSFIELSELENIRFEKLENDFFIKNNSLFIPQMDVKSSAADLTVNGTHSFDNDYEYHIRMLLSEILSRKRKKNKNNVTEFGVVEDDGLGRTSLLLKIENKGDDFKVGYDFKAATNKVKNNIKSERQTLKTILNQEYGWYKNDTTINQKSTEKKPRFNVLWEDHDSVETEHTPATVKKKSAVKVVFEN